MSLFESLIILVSKIKTPEQYGYALGYINAEYAHNFITSEQYNIVFDYIQTKRSVINA